jgi:hypothetical protein
MGPGPVRYRLENEGFDPVPSLHLAAVEYIVVKSAWDATHKQPPMLFGQLFMTRDAPNR